MRISSSYVIFIRKTKLTTTQNNDYDIFHFTTLFDEFFKRQR